MYILAVKYDSYCYPQNEGDSYSFILMGQTIMNHYSAPIFVIIVDVGFLF